MGYTIWVRQRDRDGPPGARSVIYTVDTQIEAIALATYEIDIGRADTQRVATVFDSSGLLVLAYAGRRARGSDHGRP